MHNSLRELLINLTKNPSNYQLINQHYFRKEQASRQQSFFLNFYWKLSLVIQIYFSHRRVNFLFKIVAISKLAEAHHINIKNWKIKLYIETC